MEKESRMLTVDWKPNPNDHYFHLDYFNPDGVNVGGVYMIWQGGNQARVIQVGQGENIGQHLRSLNKDPAIIAYNQYGKLYVTWAAVPASIRSGVARYLIDTWRPLIAKTFPMIFPIAVNSPFDSSYSLHL